MRRGEHENMKHLQEQDKMIEKFVLMKGRETWRGRERDIKQFTFCFISSLAGFLDIFIYFHHSKF